MLLRVTMRRLLIIPLSLLLLLAGVMAWSANARLPRADFSFINRGEIGTLDPNRMSWLQDIRVGYALWEGLYTLDAQTLGAIPGCADPIEISPDKTVYTFHLRPEARWSNGDRVAAHDFIFAWRRMLEEPGDYTYLLHCIRGAQAYQEAFDALKPKTDAGWEVWDLDAARREAGFAQVGIEAPDAATLRVTLKHPVAYFPDLCAFPPFFPLHEKSMSDFYVRNGHTYRKGFTRPPHLVSNGPYRMALWDFKRRIRLEANPHYWDREHVKSRTIEVVSAEEPMWAYLHYDSGAVDWLADASGPIGAELCKSGRKDLHVVTAFGTYFYTVNCQDTLPGGRPNPFADVRVRQAFSMAINRRPIVEDVTRMGEQIAFNYIPLDVFPQYESPKGLGQDVQRARQLMAEAGYPGGRGFPSVTLLFNSEFHHAEIAQRVRRQWLDNLGVDVQLEGVEIKIFRQRLHAKDYTIARASWFGDYNDPSTFTDKYRSVSENNDAGWKNAQYDKLCDQAAVEPDAARRMALFSQAEQILLTEQPIIPIYYYVNASLFRDNVSGLYPNARNMVMFKDIAVSR